MELVAEVFCVLPAAYQSLSKPDRCIKYWTTLCKYIPPLLSKYLIFQREVLWRSEEKKDEAAIAEWEGLCFSIPVKLGAFEVLLVVSLFLHRS